MSTRQLPGIRLWTGARRTVVSKLYMNMYSGLSWRYCVFLLFFIGSKHCRRISK